MYKVIKDKQETKSINQKNTKLWKKAELKENQVDLIKLKSSHCN